MNDNANESNADNYRINNNNIIKSKSFKYKTKMIGSLPNENDTLDTEVAAPLKCLGNFWRSLNLPLINCEIEHNLKWTRNCIVSEMYKTPELPTNPNANRPNPLIQATATTGAKFQINNAKVYVPVITLSINDNIKFLEKSKDLKEKFLGTNIDLK